MLVLRQSTAVDVLIGTFYDLTDGTTSETGETPAVSLSKNGQTKAAKNDATVPVHDSDGDYNCELDATDTDTVGTLVLTVPATATARKVRHVFQVVEESVYDNLYASGASIESGADVADAVLDEALSAHTTAGSLGQAIADVETDATAIKVVTDQMVFTKANELDVNTKSMNEVEITGLGTVASPFNNT